MIMTCFLVFFAMMHVVKAPENNNHEVRIAGLYLAGHKYFDVDRRKGNDLSWKYDDRVYVKHFPIPRLKRLHPKAAQNCVKSARTCIMFLFDVAKRSYTMSLIMKKLQGAGATTVLPPPPHSHPFTTDLEMFQFRTTATYYMCWYTMQRAEILRNFMEGKKCITGLGELTDKIWVDYNVDDYRLDSTRDPFLCATILFCPDPCYGHLADGSVGTKEALRNDLGNPCKKLRDTTCKWDYANNVDFEALQRNMINITCNCAGDKAGYEWYSRGELCDTTCKWDYANNVDFEALQRNMINITCNCAGDKAGYEWYSRGELCVDKDECEDVNTKCDKGRKCENTIGTFECLCARGQRFDVEQDMCVEHIPLPQHSRARTGKVRAQRQKSAWSRLWEYLFGLRKDAN